MANLEFTDQSSKTSKIKKYTALFIVGLVTITMLGFGLVDFAGTGSDYVIKVKNKKLTPIKFNQMLEAQKREYVSRFGSGILDSFLNTSEFTNLFLNQAIDNLVISVFLEDNGIVINADTANKFIINNPQFQGLDGNFDSTLYKTYLSQMGILESKYIASQIQDISTKFFLQLISLNNVSYVDNLASNNVRQQKVNRKITIKEFPIKYSKNFDISEQEIVSFYNQNSDEFRKPEERKIVFAQLNTKTVNFQPSKNEILQQYKKSYLYKNQNVNFYKLSFASKQEAEQVLNIIKSSNQSIEDFAQQSLGQDIDNIFFTNINYSDLQEEIQDVIATLEKSQISDVFLLGNSYNILKLDSISKGKVPPLNDVQSSIIKELKSKKSCGVVNSMAKKFNEDFESGADITEVLKDKLTLQTAFVSNEKNDFNFSKEIVDQILSNSDTYYANVHFIKDCDYFIYKIEDIIESRIEDLNVIKGGILSLIYKEKSQNIAKSEVDKFYNQILKNKKTLNGKNFSIVENSNILPENIISLIFSAQEGDLIPPFIDEKNEKFILIQVDKIENVNDVSFSKEETEAQIKKIREERREEFLSSFLETLKMKYGVRVNYNYL